jgi:hypothetical protein
MMIYTNATLIASSNDIKLIPNSIASKHTTSLASDHWSCFCSSIPFDPCPLLLTLFHRSACFHLFLGLILISLPSPILCSILPLRRFLCSSSILTLFIICAYHLHLQLQSFSCRTSYFHIHFVLLFIHSHHFFTARESSSRQDGLLQISSNDRTPCV